jgi:hypothetical protein
MSTAKPADAVDGGVAGNRRDRRGARSAVDKPTTDAASATIVIADDHPVVGRGPRTLLEEAGFTIPAEAADAPHRVVQGPSAMTGGLVVRRSGLDNSDQDGSSAAPEASTDLTAAETDRLVELERAVDRGLQTFVEVGQALAEIRERKLYRASHDTFERYCRERWGFTRRRALQFIDAAAVTTLVVNAGLPAPTHEAQARELVPLRKRPDEPETASRDTLIIAHAAGRSPCAELVRQNVIDVRHRDHPSSPTQARAAAHRAPDEPTPGTPNVPSSARSNASSKR